MAYNYNGDRSGSFGNSLNIRSLYGGNGVEQNQIMGDESLSSVPRRYQHGQGTSFRNPWYPSNTGTYGYINTGQGQLLAPNQGVGILPQNNRRMSYSTQLPTTFEDSEQLQPGFPYVDPPTRVENPVHYYVNDVNYNEMDRHSLAPDLVNGAGHPYNVYAKGGDLDFSNQLVVPRRNLLYEASRRSSATATNYPSAYIVGNNISPRMGRSPLVAQFNQYEQLLKAQALTRRRKPAPKASRVYRRTDLKPKVHEYPKYRRCSANSIHISPLNALSLYLTESYRICQPNKFQYSKSMNPKRVLTKPLVPKLNNGYDNEDSDYILYVNDILGTDEGRKFLVLDILGSGTFGQVVKCQNLANKNMYAVKVIKSKSAYLNQSLTEIKILEHINSRGEGKYFIKLLDSFMHKDHLCLVFELLSSNLYELIKQSHFQGLNIKLVKIFTRQLLHSLVDLKAYQVIHCDLKPENILLCQPDKPDVKVIDFGSACFARQTVYSYIQSRFYRSPEVILGLAYTESIDMWSLGCIVGELFLGLPMFPGTSEYNQIYKITDMLGYPPRHMLELGRNATAYFNKYSPANPEERASFKIKTLDEYKYYLSEVKGKHEQLKKEQSNNNYFKHRLLEDVILNYKPISKRLTRPLVEREREERLQLVDFLLRVLDWNPLSRLTPQQALRHPFIADVVSGPLNSPSPIHSARAMSSVEPVNTRKHST